MSRQPPRFLVTALLFALVGALLGSSPGLQQPIQAAAPQNTVSGTRTINAPYIPVTDIPVEKFAEMGIFWFGKVTTSQNYTDVRVGYNDSALFVMATVIDRQIWYDPAHNPAKITAYDGFSLTLNLGAASRTPNPSSYRFDAQVTAGEPDRTPWQIAFRGTGSAWQRDDTIPFTTRRGLAGYTNGGSPTNGWALTFIIPFQSLGLNEKPADLTAWGMGIAMHDRDSKNGTPTHKYWPETLSLSRPATFGRLVFGFPSYTPPPYTGGGETRIQHKLNGVKVVDAGVGGNLGKPGVGHLCDGNDTTRWTKWGNYNFAGGDSVVIQNQSNPHDFPCFAKFYISFPLGTVPPGKVIVSAKLVMHMWGGSVWTEALDSLIQVSTIKSSFTESTLTWNNAPLAQENIAQTWVEVIRSNTTPPWPGIAYEWDLSRPVAEAYQAKLPLRLAIYEADSAMHSGKYFTTSDTGDWNAAGRPTLIIQWGNPP